MAATLNLAARAFADVMADRVVLFLASKGVKGVTKADLINAMCDEEVKHCEGKPRGKACTRVPKAGEPLCKQCHDRERKGKKEGSTSESDDAESPKAPSAYQTFLKAKMAELKEAGVPGKERMAAAAKAWSAQKEASPPKEASTKAAKAPKETPKKAEPKYEPASEQEVEDLAFQGASGPEALAVSLTMSGKSRNALETTTTDKDSLAKRLDCLTAKELLANLKTLNPKAKAPKSKAETIAALITAAVPEVPEEPEDDETDDE
jgi:hypothetical protein